MTNSGTRTFCFCNLVTTTSYFGFLHQRYHKIPHKPKTPTVVHKADSTQIVKASAVSVPTLQGLDNVNLILDPPREIREKYRKEAIEAILSLKEIASPHVKDLIRQGSFFGNIF